MGQDASRAAESGLETRETPSDELRSMLLEQLTAVDRLTAERLLLLDALGEARARADALAAERDALAHEVEGLARRVADAGQPAAAATRDDHDWPALPAGELQAQLAASAAIDAGSEPGAIPVPIDYRGMLVAEHDTATTPRVDVVVCVHDALEDVARCLWSVIQRATRPLRLIVVNDGSAEPTTRYLARFAEANAAVTLVHQAEPPHGYTLAVNRGVRASSGDYVVLLNSDTVVTDGWLERIVAVGEAHPDVGLLGPLSNAASHQSVPARREAGGWATNPLRAWQTTDGMALLLARLAAGDERDVRLAFLNGFCLVVRRRVLDAIGEFDEANFASGYCEESDYAIRARRAGFELAVVPDAYVFHVRSRSFGTERRARLAAANYQLLRRKHGREEVDALVTETERDTSLEPLRERIAAALDDRDAGRRLLAGDDRPPLEITFVLPGIGDGGSGGSHSIYQEARAMRALGVPARIAIARAGVERAAAAYPDAGDVFVPYSDLDELAALTASSDVISATHYKSVADVRELVRRRPEVLPAYYVQDYEPLFAAPDSDDYAEAVASYTAIDGALLFAKTHWLCAVVGARHGVHVAKVQPSLDTLVYRPGPRDEGARMRVAAMIRPRTPRRQPHATVQVLERLAAESAGAVEVVTFGCTDDALRDVAGGRAVGWEHRGMLSRAAVGELLAQTDVFLDMSTYQAFGRTALEAMACGATAIVPAHGGASEFARDDDNALVVDTNDRSAVLAALSGLAADPSRRTRLQHAALQTAAAYSSERAALSEYLVMRAAHARRGAAR